MLKRASPILTLTALLILPGALLQAQEWGEVTDEEWTMQPPVAFTHANAVILFDHGSIEVSVEGVAFERHVRMKVFNEAGVREVQDATVDYWEGDEIKSLRAQTITPDGKKHKLGRNDYETSADGERRFKEFTFESVEPGSIVEYEFRNLSKRFIQLKPWYFQNDLYTLESRITWILNPGFSYYYVIGGVRVSARKPVEVEDKDRNTKSLTWTVRDILPIVEEPYMGCIGNYIMTLKFQLVEFKSNMGSASFIESWDDLGDLFQRIYLAEYTKDNKVLYPIAREIMSRAEDPSARARAVYAYVSNELKTAADDRGQFMLQENLGALINAGIGTSNEKNVLLCELGRLVGLAANPVLIAATDRVKFDPEIRQIEQFNRLIACVDTGAGRVFMDALTEYCPFGMLPPRCVVEQGLLLGTGSTDIVTIPNRQPQTCRTDVSTITVDTHGQAVCSTVTEFSGYYTASYGELYDREGGESFCRGYFLDRLGLPYELGEHSFRLDEETSTCVSTIHYTMGEYGRRSDTGFTFIPVGFAYMDNPFIAEKRYSPIMFDYPFTYHSVVKVHLGDSVAGIQAPENVYLNITGAQYTRQYIETEGGIDVDSRLEIRRSYFDQSAYEELRGFFEDMAAANFQEVAILFAR